MFTPFDIIFIIAMMSIAIFVQGYGGLGFGIVSITLLSFLSHDIERLSVLVSMVSVVASFILMHASKKQGHIHWKKIFLLYGGIIFGLPVGYWFISVMGDQPVFKIALGVILVVYGINGFRTPSAGKAMANWAAIPIGALSGFICGAFVSGGPPLVIYLYSQTEDAREMKASIQAVFVISTITRLIIVAFGKVGYTVDIVYPALIAIPILIPILLTAHWYSKKHSPATFKRVVNGLIILFGFIILLKSIFQLLRPETAI